MRKIQQQKHWNTEDQLQIQTCAIYLQRAVVTLGIDKCNDKRK